MPGHSKYTRDSRQGDGNDFTTRCRWLARTYVTLLKPIPGDYCRRWCDDACTESTHYRSLQIQFIPLFPVSSWYRKGVAFIQERKYGDVFQNRVRPE